MRARSALVALALSLALAACGEPTTGSSSSAEDDAPSVSPAQVTTPEISDESSLITECADLAVTPSGIWRCTAGQLSCTDPVTLESLATRGEDELAGPGDFVFYRAIVPWEGDSALVLMAEADGAGAVRVELVELAYEGGEIVERSRTDATAALGPLFAGYDSEGLGAWAEVNVVAAGGRLVLAALDVDFQFQLFTLDPGTLELKELGAISLEEYRALVPYGADALVVEGEMEDETKLSLVRLSLEDGSQKTVRDLSSDAVGALCCCWLEPTDERLYFVSNAVVYAVDVTGAGEVCPVGALTEAPAQFRAGALAEGRFVCHGLTGQLVSCEVENGFEIETVRLADTVSSGLAAAAATDFALVCPGVTATVRSDIEDEDLEELLAADEAALDAALVVWGGSAWRALDERGLTADLSGSEAIAGFVQEASPAVRTAVAEGDEIRALPVAAQAACQMIDVEGLASLLGVSADELPRDWPGFLKALAALADRGTLKDSDAYALMDAGLGTDEQRVLLLQDALEACALWAEGHDADEVEQVLSSVLEAFEGIDWAGLGLEDVPVGEVDPSVRPLIISGSYASPLGPGVTFADDGVEYWPLAATAGADRLIPQTLVVACVSPRSSHGDATRAFLEHLLACLDAPTRLSLMAEGGEPERDGDYDQNVAYMRSVIAEIEQQLATAPDAATQAELAAELEDAQAFAARLEEAGQWSVTKESLERYRSLQDDMVVVGDMVWADEAVSDAAYAFLEGDLTAKQCAATLAGLMGER